MIVEAAVARQQNKAELCVAVLPLELSGKGWVLVENFVIEFV